MVDISLAKEILHSHCAGGSTILRPHQLKHGTYNIIRFNIVLLLKVLLFNELECMGHRQSR